MKSGNSHTGIKKKQDNERRSFMYRKYQNRKNNADENFRENSETKRKTIDPFCHQKLSDTLSDTSSKKIKDNNVSPKQFKHNKTNLTNKNVVCYGKSSKIKNVKMSQKCPLQKIMKKQGLWADATKLLREKQKMLHNLKMWRLKCRYMSKHAQLQKCLRIFNEKTSHGPIYVCTICNQTWFRNFVYDIQRIKCSSLESTMLKKCSTGYVSVDNKVWLCRTCRLAIKQGKVPKLSIENGMGFPEKPHELDLHGMEECIISPRLLFFQMRSNILGGRTIVRGNVVNIAVDIAPTVNKLPRDMNELHTVAVTYKRKLQYKKCEFCENVRPFVVWRAAHYLVKNSCVFKGNEVDLDTNWFANAIMCETDENKTEETLQITYNEHMNTEMSDVDESSNSNKNDEDDMNIRDKYEEVSDDDYEILGAVDRDTLLQDATDFTKGFTFAPGQGKLPKSIFCDDDAEYLAFPTIFCGQRRKENKYEKVYYSDVCKYELRSVDKRVAKNVPNIFFKFKKV